MTRTTGIRGITRHTVVESRAMGHLYNVHCMLCGRLSGHVRDGTFYRVPNAPPLVVRAGRTRCGFCGGSVYLEAEDSPFGQELARQAIRSTGGARAPGAARRAS